MKKLNKQAVKLTLFGVAMSIALTVLINIATKFSPILGAAICVILLVVALYSLFAMFPKHRSEDEDDENTVGPEPQGEYAEEDLQSAKLIADALETLGVKDAIVITPYATINSTKYTERLIALMCHAMVNDKMLRCIITEALSTIMKNSSIQTQYGSKGQ